MWFGLLQLLRLQHEAEVPAALALRGLVARQQRLVPARQHPQVDVRAEAALGGREGTLEAEAAVPVGDDGAARRPHVAALRALLPVLDPRVSERPAVERGEDDAGGDVAV